MLVPFLLSLLLSQVLSQSIVFTPSIPTIGMPVVGRCSADASEADSLVWERRSDENSSFIPLYSPTFTVSNLSNTSNNTVYVEFSVVFQHDIASTYKCEARNTTGFVRIATYLLTSQIIFIPRNVDFDVYDGDASFEVSCYFQSSPNYLNLTVEWCFQPYVFPNIDTSVCTPLNSSTSSAVSPTSNRSSNTEYSSRYRVQGVSTADAGVYRCNVSNGVGDLTMGVRVRVRDRLEILWPAIGIMIQMVVITICIIGHYLWDTYKERKTKKARLEKEKQNILNPNSPPADPVTDHDEHLANEVLIKVVPN